MKRYWFPVLAIFCLAACGKKDTDPGPGGVSVGEARALDDAASMLDQQRLPPGALASGAPAAQPGATASPTPSSAPAT
jgi:hypothetical protein